MATRIEKALGADALSDDEFDKLGADAVKERAPLVKLTGWANEPQARTLKEDLEASKQTHDDLVTKIKHWRNLMKVEGDVKPKKRPGRASVQPKLIRRQAEWRYSALSEPFLSSEKLFDVKPATFEDADGARQNDLVLNHQFRTKIDRVKFFDEYVRTDVDEGTVIVRVGWERHTTPVQEEVPVWEYREPESPEQIQAIEQAVAERNRDRRSFDEQAPPELKAAVEYFIETGVPTNAVQVGTEMVTVQKVVTNQPALRFVAPENFYFDPSCGGDLEKANFAIESFETSKADLLKEGDRYKNLDHVNWENATPLTDSEHSTSTPSTFNFKDTLRKRVVAYEYWGFYDVNGDGRLVPIVATWIGDTLIRLEENPYPDQKIPYVVETYMPIKREVAGEPDAELLEDNQAILGAVTRGMIDLLGRSANGQQGFAKGMLDVVNRRRFAEGQDYEFNPNMPPQNGIVEHKFPEIPQSAPLMIQFMNQEAEALTGVKSFSGGLSGNAYGDVAAGVKGMLDAAAKREMSILRRLANGIVKIGRKIVAMNQIFLSEEETIRITNSEFVKVKREDLKGEFDLIVDISTAEIDANKASELAFMLQTMGNTVDFGIVKMILVEIARLKRMPVLAKMIEEYQPTPDPAAEQIKQMELLKLQTEIQKNSAEIERIKSETQRNIALAQKAMAEAEQQALDTIEQETGTKQERELQRQREQAQGNQDLKITDALLKTKKPDETDPDISAAVGWNQLSRGIQRSEDSATVRGFPANV